MKKVTIADVLLIDEELEEDKVLLLSENDKKRKDVKNRISEFVIMLDEKIDSLTGERNINKLSKIMLKWQEALEKKSISNPRFETDREEKSLSNNTQSSIFSSFLNLLSPKIEQIKKGSKLEGNRFDVSLMEER